MADVLNSHAKTGATIIAMQPVVARTENDNTWESWRTQKMTDTKPESESTSPPTSAQSQKRNSGLPEIDTYQAVIQLGILQDDIRAFNQKTGGRMTLNATEDGLLVIVASLPLHSLGVVEGDSGRVVTLDGKAVV